MQTAFSVGESIGTLFNVTVNGLVQERNVDYFHIAYTSKITFAEPPLEGSNIVITYYKGRNSIINDNLGNMLQFANESYTYDGTSLEFTLLNDINSIVTLDINGLVEEEGVGYDISGEKRVLLLGTPTVGSRISITYIY